MVILSGADFAGTTMVAAVATVAISGDRHEASLKMRIMG
jgi:hypothetical protein